MFNVCQICFRKLLTINAIKLESRLISVLFYGSDEFSLVSLKLLHKDFISENNKLINKLQIVSGSKLNIISQFGAQNQLTCHSFPYKVPVDCFDVGIVASFGHLIPGSAIKACRLGMINIHASLLPRWRGAAPINYAILHNDLITGITIMKIMPKKFDTGDIVLQKPYQIPPRITSKQLMASLAEMGSQLLWQCLTDLEMHLNNAKPQPNEGITYAPKFDESYGKIEWSTMTSYQIDRIYRAFVGYVDIHCQWIDGTNLKLNEIIDPELVATLRLNELSNCDNPEPGFVFYHKKRRILCISCANNTWIAFNKFTLKGRKRASALQFYNGFVNKHQKVVLR